MTIILPECGRLGNQLFQYVAIRSKCPDEHIAIYGMRSLKELFDGVDAYFADEKTSLRDKFLLRLSRRLAKRQRKKNKRFITEVIETSEAPHRIAVKDGLLPGLKYCHGAFFQNEALLETSVIRRLSIKPVFADRARQILSGFEQDRPKIFLHIRRGDYISWPNREAPAVLPARWYRDCQDWFRKELNNPIFLICSDDTPYVYDVFGDMPDVWVSTLSEKEDFALMAQCDGGILSASSFSWWAACLARQANPDRLFYAPTYWGGHKRKTWHPSFIETSWITYRDVISD